MTTVAEIADEAFDGVAADITDAVHTCTLTRIYPNEYNVTLGDYAEVTLTWAGRAVFCNAAAVRDIWPEMIIGPTDQVLLLEGFTPTGNYTGPKENDILTVNHVERTVMAVQDIAGAGTLWYVIAR